MADFAIDRKDTQRIDQLFIQARSLVRIITSKYLVNGINNDPELEKNILDLQKILNKSFPQTNEEEAIARTLKYLFKFGRAKTTKMLFEIKQACLLMLVDNIAITKALKIGNVLNVKYIKDENRYILTRHITKSSDAIEKSKMGTRKKRESNVEGIMNEPPVISKINWADEDSDE